MVGRAHESKKALWLTRRRSGLSINENAGFLGKLETAEWRNWNRPPPRASVVSEITMNPHATDGGGGTTRGGASVVSDIPIK